MQRTKRPSQRQIAKMVGVSQVAVCRALKGDTSLAKKTREQILAVAEQLGYRPNRLMSNLYSGKTKLVGAFLQNFSSFFFQRLLHGVEREAFKNSYSMIPIQAVSGPDSDEYEINVLLENQVDGLIVSPRCVKETTDFYSELLRRGEKIVFINQKVKCPGACCVYSDDTKGSELAMNCLFRHGHSAIAYVWSGLEYDSNVCFRKEGYENQMEKAGYRYHPQWILFKDDRLEENINKMVSTFPEITAFFCETDYDAIKVIEILGKMGKTVPNDFSIVGYGNTIEFVDFMKVPLTTVCQFPETMGQTAVRLLLQMLDENRNIADDFIQPVQLIERDSVRSITH